MVLIGEGIWVPKIPMNPLLTDQAIQLELLQKKITQIKESIVAGIIGPVLTGHVVVH